MPKTALIIGGSISGLLAAHTLAKTYDEVSIHERDTSEHTGVPQAYHAHNLASRGLDILSKMLPDLICSLDNHQVPIINWTTDLRLMFGQQWLPRIDLGIVTRPMTRNLLEALIREQVLANPKIHIEHNSRVNGYILGSDTGKHIQTIKGVRLQNSHTATADLIVDASGRNSKTPEWLTELGCQPPKQETVDAKLGYATQLYERLAVQPDCKLLGIGAVPPHVPRSGVLIAQENGSWIVTLSGAGTQNQPPTDKEQFGKFIESLRVSDLHLALRGATPAGPIKGYGQTQNIRRRYDITQPPGNLIIMGDALCTFNPVYGQGITSAAIQAELLSKKAANDNFAEIHQEFLRAVTMPWLIATGSDFAYPHTEGKRPPGPTQFLQKYIERYAQVMDGNLAMSRTFVGMINMTNSPLSLFSPPYVARMIDSLLNRNA